MRLLTSASAMNRTGPGKSRHPTSVNRRLVLTGILAAGAGIPAPSWADSAPDPLPSWNDGAVKKSIVDFVSHVTTAGNTDFIPPEERIATFDNDGTLWTEQPFYFQVAFAFDQIKKLAPSHPEWRQKQPFKALLEKDMKGLVASGEKGLLKIIAVTHAGMTTDVFRDAVLDWTETARHPRFGKRYIELVYQPMLELLAYLRSNGFKTFIVSGGGIDFMRPWTEKVYGIPPEQVVGSSGVMKFEFNSGGTPVLRKKAQVEFVDDGPGKPAGINRFIGRRPVFSFGNSDGDQQMLEWTAAGDKARFAGLIHHTDAKREYAYDRKSPIGKLDKAWDEAEKRGWTVVDMRRDWKIVYPFEK